MEIKEMKTMINTMKRSNRVDEFDEDELQIQQHIMALNKTSNEMGEMAGVLVSKQHQASNELYLALEKLTQMSMRNESSHTEGIFAQDKAFEKAMMMAQGNKIEVEKLNERVFELEKQLDEKREMEVELVDLRETLSVFNNVILEQKKEIEELQTRNGVLIHKNEALEKTMTAIVTNKEQLKRAVAQLLQKQLDDKHKLELENQQLKENLDMALSNVGGGGGNENSDQLKKEIDELNRKLQEATALLEAQEAINNSIILKEQSVSNEFHEARKELINGLKGMSSSLTIGVKKMAELDLKPFLIASNKLDCSAEEALSRSIRLCGAWRKNIKDPKWHPFKAIKVGDTYKEVIDEEDEKLKRVKQESGEEVYKAVITAILETNQYNPTGDINEPIKEIWNFKEGKRATLKEGIRFLLKMYMRRV